MVSAAVLVYQETCVLVINELDREYVKAYWPNPDTPASQLHEMFNRLVAADEKTSRPRENGTSNQSPQAT